MNLIKNVVLFTLFYFFNLSAYAAAPIEITTFQNSSEAIRYPEILERMSLGGDFVGNGGDPLKLRYAIIYHYLNGQKEINIPRTLIFPQNIYSYTANSEESPIVFFNNKIFIPSTIYQDYNSIKDIIFRLFSYQNVKIKNLYEINNLKIRNLLIYLETPETFSTILDLNFQLEKTGKRFIKYLSSTYLLSPFDNTLTQKPHIEFVYDKVTDNFGSLVCGKKRENGTIEINVLCINNLTTNNFQLLYVHELLRILRINDDNYSTTVEFALSEFFDNKFHSSEYWDIDFNAEYF